MGTIQVTLIAISLLPFRTSYCSELETPARPFDLDMSRNCGPACVAFLDKTFSGGHSFADVVEVCPASEDGTSLADLQRAAKQLGYHTLPFRATVSQLKRLPYRAILHREVVYGKVATSRRSINHFVVLLSWEPELRAFRVFDPPTRITSMNEHAARDELSGAGLILSATPIPPLKEVLAPKPIRSKVVVSVGLVTTVMLAIAVWTRLPNLAATVLSALARSVLLLVAGLTIGCGVGPTDESPHRYDAGPVPIGSVIQHTFRVYNYSDDVLHYKKIAGP